MRRPLAIGALALTTGWSAAAPAQCPPTRPTDPGGSSFITYDDPAAVATFDTPRVRVWYATAGDHAPDLAPGAEGAPLDVEIVGAILEEALTGFEDLGFAPPPSDAGIAGCAWSDGRLDAYLVDFGSGADGTVGLDDCASDGGVERCAGHVVLDHRYLGYPSFEAGARTVGPHELFHLIQYGYDAAIDRYWAEGTAQWATKQLYPELRDLEAFLPFFFDALDRPLDTSPGGATAGFLYGTAAWPVYLEHRFGAGVILEIFEAMAQGASPALDAVGVALDARGATLPEAFLTFSAFNAATGSRGGLGGYPDATSYPEAPVVDLGPGPGVLVDDRLAGLAAHLYRVPGGHRVVLDGDPTELAALALPLADGVADVPGAVPLPADLTAPAIVVVAGQRTSKADALYQLRAEALPEPPPPPAEDPPEEPPPPAGTPAPASDGGCTATGRPGGAGGWLLFLALAGARRRWDRPR